MTLAYSPKEMYEEIELQTSIGLVPNITASPGVGKSAIVQKFAKEYGLKLIDCRLSTYMPEDLNGFPMRDGDKASFIPFDTFPIEGDEIPAGYQGWCIFFDEITSAPKATQAAAYKIILDRMTGSKHLHPNTVMVAAGNKSTDRAVVNQMSTALKSRMINYFMEPSVADFTENGLQKGFDPRVLAFVNEMPSRLMRFDPSKADSQLNFPCPRTYEFLSRMIKGRAIERRNLGRFAGTIGEGTAIEFMTFTELYGEIPKIADILANPGSISVPVKAGAKYATMFTMIEHANQNTIDPMLEYIKKFGLDQQIVFSRSVNVKDPLLAEQNLGFSGYVNDMIKYMAAA